MSYKNAFSRKYRARKANEGPRLTAKPLRFDVASTLHIGARTSQQDALLTNFVPGEDHGLALLADGLGGHQGGDIASAIAIAAAFADLKTHFALTHSARTAPAPLLSRAIFQANQAIADHVVTDPDLDGMGTTLMACIANGPDLHWASVGDSLMYLQRATALTRLNEDHSMAAEFEAMVASGDMDAAIAKEHPQRHYLTSAISGTTIPLLDCPQASLTLKAGDFVVMASDGLLTLSEKEICAIVSRRRSRRSEDILHGLLDALLAVNDPNQDNVALIIIKALIDTPVDTQAAPKDTK